MHFQANDIIKMVMIPFAIGQEPALEGLRRVDDPDIVDLGDVWILGAWQFGHGTTYHEGGIDPGRDWLAAVWRTSDGRIGSYGRVRDHCEYLGMNDVKVFYTATEPDERKIVRIYDRVAERLSEDWGVAPRKVLGIDGIRLLDWLESLGGVTLSFGSSEG